MIQWLDSSFERYVATPVTMVHERWTGDTQYLLAERCFNGTYVAQAVLAILILASGDITMIIGFIVAGVAVAGYHVSGGIRRRLRAEDARVKNGGIQDGAPFLYLFNARVMTLVFAMVGTMVAGSLGVLLYVAFRGVEVSEFVAYGIWLNYGKVICLFVQVWLSALALYAATMPQPPSRLERFADVAFSAT